MISRELNYDKQAIDAFKGILILLIVLGHNNFFSKYYPLGFNVLYNFHVACFLILPFLREDSSIKLKDFTDKAVRYFVPHTVFFALACIAYYVLTLRNTTSIGSAIMSALAALLLSTQAQYKSVTGMNLFWFLPAIFILIAILAWYRHTSSRNKIITIAFTLLVHFFIGLLPKSGSEFLPWSAGTVLFLFPLGLLIAAITKIYKNDPKLYLAASLAFPIFIYISLSTGSFGISNGENQHSIRNPVELIFHDFYLICAFLALLGIAEYIRIPVLSFIGRRSLFIFLTHTMIWQAIMFTGIASWLLTSINSPIFMTSAAFILTVAIALGSCLLLESCKPLYSMIFPKSMADFRSALRFNTR